MGDSNPDDIGTVVFHPAGQGPGTADQGSTAHCRNRADRNLGAGDGGRFGSSGHLDRPGGAADHDFEPLGAFYPLKAVGAALAHNGHAADGRKGGESVRHP
jgi:hypothetical protein